MSDRNIQNVRQTTNVIAASGRLRNEYFLLTADRILLEVDEASFELVSATAEGNIQVHLTTPDEDGEHVIFAQSAVYQPHNQRLDLGGWIGSRENGIESAPVATIREVVLPNEESFLLPHMQEQAEKRLPISHSPLRKAA